MIWADYWQRQLLFTILGAIALVTAALFDYRHLELLAQPSYFLLMASLVAVYLVGEVKSGAQRWLNLGITDVQPTEAGKFLLIVFLAWYLSRFQDRIRRLSYLLGIVVLLLLPLVLVYAQPDLGMTVTLAFISGTLILINGVRLTHVLLGVVAMAAAWPILRGTLQDYMVERIDIFLDPSSNLDAAFKRTTSADQHRQRRLDRDGLGRGNTESTALFAGPAYRFHLQRHRRRTGLCWYGHGSVVTVLCNLALGAHC